MPHEVLRTIIKGPRSSHNSGSLLLMAIQIKARGTPHYKSNTIFACETLVHIGCGLIGQSGLRMKAMHCIVHSTLRQSASRLFHASVTALVLSHKRFNGRTGPFFNSTDSGRVIDFSHNQLR